jgi:hypothetical protein
MLSPDRALTQGAGLPSAAPYRWDMVKRKIHTLHRYFLHADFMRRHWVDDVRVNGAHLPDSGTPAGIRQFCYLSYWYGALHVVAEGWRDLRLTDPVVDPLLASERIGLLRRYRNGTFHFQDAYFDGRILDLIMDDGSAQWVNDLHQAIGAALLELLLV